MARIHAIDGALPRAVEGPWRLLVTEAGACAGPGDLDGRDGWIPAPVPGTAAQLAARNAAVAAGTYRFLFARNLTDLPDRDEKFRRETYRIVAGFRGTFNEDWNYEISATTASSRSVPGSRAS